MGHRGLRRTLLMRQTVWNACPHPGNLVVVVSSPSSRQMAHCMLFFLLVTVALVLPVPYFFLPSPIKQNDATHMYPSAYRDRTTVDERRRDAARARERHPTRVPCIIEAIGGAPALSKSKFLVPGDLRGDELLHHVRKQLTLDSATALFLLCRGRLVCGAHTARSLPRDPHDGLVYLHYSLENCFG